VKGRGLTLRVGLLAAAMAWSGVAVAQTSDEALFAQAAAALAADDPDAAITSLEALADRGFVHPDASFDRGLAYARRARGAKPQPGDLGRAAAGFEEARLLRPGDAAASTALENVRGEVSRRRSQRGKDEIAVGDPPDRLLVELASQRVWAALAAASSLVLSLGLWLRRRPAGPARVTGVLALPLGALGLALFAPAAWWSGVLAHQRGLGVVTVSEVVLVTARGKRVDAPAVPEGARVELGRAGTEGRVRVRWGSYEGWAPAASIRKLAR
jgi:hypothetical protein